MISIHIGVYDYLVPKEVSEEIARLRAEVERLTQERETLLRERKGEVWFWQGDGYDHPESLTCPILIQPDNLRELLTVVRAADELLEASGLGVLDQTSTIEALSDALATYRRRA